MAFMLNIYINHKRKTHEVDYMEYLTLTESKYCTLYRKGTRQRQRLTQLPVFTSRQTKTRMTMMKVSEVDAATRIDLTEVDVEALDKVKVEVAGKYAITAESSVTFRQIVGNRVAEYVMRKTKGIPLVI